MNQDAFKDIPAEMVPVMKSAMIIGLIVFDVIYFFYLRNLVGLMKLVSPANRRIEPNRIWWLLLTFISSIAIIPLFLNRDLPKIYDTAFDVLEYTTTLFSLVFTFYMVNKIAESLDIEFKSRRAELDEKPTLNLGLFMCISQAATLLSDVQYISFIGEMASIAGLIAWIMYWVKTHEYRKKLEAMPPASTTLNDLGIF